MIVNDIMKKDIITISPDTRIGRVKKLLLENTLPTIPVTIDGRLVGIIYSCELLKVKRSNFKLPAKEYMDRYFLTVRVQTPLQKVEDLMVKYNLISLPVLTGNKLTGVVYKEDMLISSVSYIYNNELVKTDKNVFNIKDRLNDLPQEYLSIIKRVSVIFNKYNIKVYLIGGMVRNIILGRESQDIDFVIEGTVVEEGFKRIISSIAKEINGKCKYNLRFKTGSIMLSSGLNLDFAVARKEYYPFPGSLPEVKVANLKDDIWRRDFTINTLILDISSANWGNIYDYLNGNSDLNNKLIRTLHCFSFLDDPTRIIRGIRQAVELDFEIEEETIRLMKEALIYGFFPGVMKDRILKELKLLFTKKINSRFIKYFKQLPVMKLIDIDVNLNNNIINKLYKLEDILAYFDEKNYNVKNWLLRIAVIINDNISKKKLSDLSIAQNEKSILTFSDRNEYIRKINNTNSLIELADILKKLSEEKIILLMISDKKLVKKIKHYYDNLIRIELIIDGNDLINLGLKPGPNIKNVLKQVWAEKVKGELKNYQEELDYAAKLISENERS